ncbi:MAG: tRNA lysidine(34) synthetase TilS [Ruminococcus sp.]|jgi:tRNA(Ile)-lysidine synthase
MQRKIWEYIRQYDIIQKGDRIVAGISGGADSVYLFFLLLELRRKGKIEFAAVHVNHMLRGQEADEDERFVRQLCKDHSVSCQVFAFPIETIAREEKLSLEEAGRIRRYQAFEEFAQKWGGNKIALAHHRNDCAETMLYNLARGTGISGLCSLRPVRNSLIRPLLCMNRAEIEQYLEERQIPYCTDSTNQDTAYARNYIRRRILPGLQEHINERAVEHMSSAAADLAEIWDYLEGCIDERKERLVKRQGDSLLMANELALEKPLFWKLVIKRCLEEAAGTSRDFTRIHFQDVMALWDKDTGKSLDLPYELAAVRTYRGVQLRKKDIRDKRREEESFRVRKISIPGCTQLDGKRLETVLLEKTGKLIPQKTYTKWIDYDKIKDTLVVRTRLPGDYIVINESGGRKKLKDYFIDQKIPREERDRVLLVADGSEIVWIVGYRLSQNYMVEEHTRHILRMEIKGGTVHEGENQRSAG